jgi:large repetitive protein
VTLISGTAQIGLDVSPTMFVSDGTNPPTTITTSGSVTIQAGATSIIVRVDSLEDALIEPLETFSVALDVISGVQPGQFKAFGAIQDTTIAAAIASVTSTTVKEGQKAQFTVTLSAATTQASSVRLSLVDVTTTSGLDYSTDMKYSDDGGLTYRAVVSGGIANIRAGVTSFLVRVTTLKDAIEEPSETYQLVVNPVSGLSSNVGMGTGTILDKSKKEKSLYEQMRSVTENATSKAESMTGLFKNWWSSKPFSGLFSRN